MDRGSLALLLSLESWCWKYIFSDPDLSNPKPLLSDSDSDSDSRVIISGSSDL